MKSERIFKIALFVSVAAHVFALAYQSSSVLNSAEQIIKIPVILEQEPPAPIPKPPPPPPPPEKQVKKKPRPKALKKKIDKVISGDGLRSGELVDAELGNYSDEVAPQPVLEIPSLPEPKIKSKPKIDVVKLAREFLGEIRTSLMKRKKYPLAAQRMSITGAVSVVFVIQANSTFENVKIKRSSGHDILDKAALATVKNLSGKIKRPSQLGKNVLKTSVILRYELN